MAFLRASREELLLHCTKTGEVLASSLDYRKTLAHVAQWLTPILGHWFVIDLYDPLFDALRRISITHVDPAKKAIADELQRRPPPDYKDAPKGPRHVLTTGKPEIDSNITDEDLHLVIPEARQIELIKSLGIHSVLSIPLKAKDRLLGTLTWVSSDIQRQHGERDIPFATEIASIAAAHIENARLYWEVWRGLEMRDHILRIVSHDLRNPLSAIKLSADLLNRKKEQEGVNTPLVQKVTRSLESASDRMNELIQDVISFRELPRSMESPIELERVDFDELLKRSVNFIAPLCERRKIKLEMRLNTQTEILLDGDKIQTAVSLLLENMIFSVLSGSSIRISTAQKNNSVYMEVIAQGKMAEPISVETGLRTANEIFERQKGKFEIERNEQHIGFKVELPSNLTVSTSGQAA
jgi:signal transduction histidine kinase